MAAVVAASPGPGSPGPHLRWAPPPARGWAPGARAAPEQKPGRGRGGPSTRPPWGVGSSALPPPRAADGRGR